MKIGIIGAGFTGLSAAYNLAKAGHKVVIIEQESEPGGLAAGFVEKGWRWNLERHYHHIFTSDMHIQKIAKEVNHNIFFSRPKTSAFIKGEIRQLDSPLSLLQFSYVSLLDRIRMGIVLAYLKITPIWHPLEKISASKFIQKHMGKNNWKVLWHPLFKGKFGVHANKIPTSWFWARIKKRSAYLGYPKGGFGKLAKSIEKGIKSRGGKFIYDSRIVKIQKHHQGFEITTEKGRQIYVDKIICTLPTPIFVKLVPNLPRKYIKGLTKLKGLGAVTLVLSLKKKLLNDGTYWLNINDPGFPFLAVVEHTNFASNKYYSGKHIVYIGNYLPNGHKYFDLSGKELLNKFEPFLKKINHSFDIHNVSKTWVFKSLFAQPIVPPDYSKNVPKIKTPVPGILLANIQQVYPWDRGTNYAVEIGNKAAKILIKESR